MELFRLDGRTAVVTGGGSGIGAGICRAFVAQGARVVVAEVDEARGARVAAELGPAAAFRRTDVADRQSVEAAVEAAVALGGRLDVFVNCAGVLGAGTVLETPDDEWDRMFDVNARGVFHGCRAAVARMLRQTPAGGSIVNVASVAGLVGLKRRAVYCASKGAVVALTRAVAADHAGDGVRCNAICPGTIHTPLLEEAMGRTTPDVPVADSLAAALARQPVGRLGTPDDIAAMAVYLASDAATFVTGATMIVDGGATAR